MKSRLKNMKGITLIALVITIIVLLILAGVTIATLTGENGLLNRAKTAAEENRKAEAIEDVKLRIMEVQTEKEGKATLEDLVEYLENNTTNEYKITKVSSGTASLVEGSIESSEVGNAEKIYITSVKYGYEIEVNSNMTVTERVVASSSGSSSSESGSGIGEVTGGVSQEEYDSLQEEYENFRKAVAKSIKDAGGVETNYDSNATTFDTNIKGILTEVTKDATATKDEILDGYTAYNNGRLVTGEYDASQNATSKIITNYPISGDNKWHQYNELSFEPSCVIIMSNTSNNILWGYKGDSTKTLYWAYDGGFGSDPNYFEITSNGFKYIGWDNITATIYAIQ